MANNSVIKLSNVLRDKGITVSIRTTQTACKVWNLLSTQISAKELKDALKCIYVKDPSYEKVYEDTFDDLFIRKDNIYFIPKNKKKQMENLPVQSEDISLNNIQNNKNQTQIKHEQPKDKEKIEIKHRVTDKEILNQNIANLEHNQHLLELCRKLGIKIANQRTTRQKHANKCNVNMPRTIRYNLKNGGKLISLINSKPHKRKSRHFFLNDISGSCAWISTWFFIIMYGCRRSFDRVKAYEFDNKIMDMTDILDAETYQESFELVTHRRMENRMINDTSDMAHSFEMFLDEVPLNTKSNVIILTDCRDWRGKREDGVLESAVILRKIVQKSHRVMIFNPESKKRWNTPTSCVRDYQNVGAEVYEIGTLDQFAKLITQL